MLLAFEGTGMQILGGTWEKGLNDLSHTGSFVWRFSLFTTDNITKYFPGPNVQGSNCDDIFEQAKEFYRKTEMRHIMTEKTKINLVGYSRGAYIAMGFAKYLEKKGLAVDFLGMFDAVSVDVSMDKDIAEGSRWKEMKVPNNVKNCYLAYRSEITGSRSETMNHIGKVYENGKEVIHAAFPGSHAALGGFPNQAGIGDAPNPGQGDPNDLRKFDKRKEITAWWKAGDFISQSAFKHGLLKKSLVPQPEPKSLLPKEQWYNYIIPNVRAWNSPMNIY